MSFNLRRNLLLSAFIIAIIGIVWLVMQGVLYAFGLFDENLPAAESEFAKTAYVEKINNFSLREFNENAQVSHLIEAKNYLSFKDTPTLLLNPKVTTYDKNGKENYVLKAQRANYFENGNIKFIGKVDIAPNAKISHQIKTPELLIGADTKDLVSHKEVIYLGQRLKIIAQGMQIKSKQDKMQLLGNTQILQDNGAKILTKTLFIDQTNGQKHYYSNNKTTYISKNNKVFAQKMEMNGEKKLVNLSGKVKILQGSNFEINTKNLVIDQSDNNDIYSTNEDIRYRSKVADIKAKGMIYNVKNQKIKLSGGVVGRYE